MSGKLVRIGIVAPGSPIAPAAETQVRAVLAGAPALRAELVFHPQCFECVGHFAGNDERRRAALVEFANDPSLDAIWFARGGYGAVRILDGLVASFGGAADGKVFLGYSDAGAILSELYRARRGRPVHGPMPGDIVRSRGAEAVKRALVFLAGAEESGFEPSLAAETRPVATFNMSVVRSLLDTEFQPDLSGHVLLLEEIDETAERIDLMLWQITHCARLGRLAGLRIGRCSGEGGAELSGADAPAARARAWCRKTGIEFLGDADVGHDADNKIAPFGLWRG